MTAGASLAAACSSTKPGEVAKDGSVTVKHIFGETKIPGTAQARRQRRFHRAGTTCWPSESSRSRSPTGSAASRSAYGHGRSRNWAVRSPSCST